MSGKYMKPAEAARSRAGEEVGNKLVLTVMSFGYKEGSPPVANMLFDVRFLKNPYWVPELRNLTGLDKAVQEYVLSQPMAVKFLETLYPLVESILPRFTELELTEFTIAFGCTGGQHRSTALAEALAKRINQTFPEFEVVRCHRELAGRELPGREMDFLSSASKEQE